MAKMGRPPLPAEQQRHDYGKLYMTSDEAERLRRTAQRLNISQSEVLRMGLRIITTIGDDPSGDQPAEVRS